MDHIIARIIMIVVIGAITLIILVDLLRTTDLSFSNRLIHCLAITVNFIVVVGVLRSKPPDD